MSRSQFLLRNLFHESVIILLRNFFVAGNSLYSSSSLNKSSHRSITYVHQENINKAIITHFFAHLDQTSSEIYGVKSLKKYVIQNLPVHLGRSVCLKVKYKC